MTNSPSPTRNSAYGENNDLSPIDRLGVWLSGRRIRREVRSLRGLDVADVGCGFDATFARTVLGQVGTMTLVDMHIADDLKSLPRVRVVEGVLPEALHNVESESQDLILCMSVLEHLWEPARTLDAFRRILRPGGTCLINVPSWRGKRFLEFSAFRLGLSPVQEMDDHKWYFDPHDLWPLLVRAGFLPHNIRCFRHKFGLNTFAICTLEAAAK